MFRTYSDMSFMIKIQRYFIEIRWKIAIEIISSTIVDIKFSPVFKLFIIFREEIEEKKTNKVENNEESKKPLVEDEDRYLHLVMERKISIMIFVHTQVLNEYYWVWIWCKLNFMNIWQAQLFNTIYDLPFDLSKKLQ